MRRSVAVIGGDFVTDEPAHGGFSASYAGVVTTTAGHAFVKASAADWHADSLLFLREEMRTLSFARRCARSLMPIPIALRPFAAVDDAVGADNILISDGRAHLLDWPHARREPRGPTCPVCWPSVEASGGPSCEEAWAVFQEHGAPPQAALLPVISAFGSFLWYPQAQPDIPQLPELRAFQRA